MTKTALKHENSELPNPATLQTASPKRQPAKTQTGTRNLSLPRHALLCAYRDHRLQPVTTNQKENMNKKEQIELIERLFDALKYAQIGQQGWSDYWRNMVKTIETSERQHRGGRLSHQCGIPVKVATKLFAVQYVITHRAGKWTDEKGHEHKPYVPHIEDILGTRLECFQGYAIWKHDRKKISKAVSKADALAFVQHVDYAKLMEVPE